eukprot:scaffold91660_cov31-Tisochrysis_lutea.AAC.2
MQAQPTPRWKRIRITCSLAARRGSQTSASESSTNTAVACGDARASTSSTYFALDSFLAVTHSPARRKPRADKNVRISFACWFRVSTCVGCTAATEMSSASSECEPISGEPPVRVEQSVRSKSRKTAAGRASAQIAETTSPSPLASRQSGQAWNEPRGVGSVIGRVTNWPSPPSPHRRPAGIGRRHVPPLRIASTAAAAARLGRRWPRAQRLLSSNHGRVAVHVAAAAGQRACLRVPFDAALAAHSPAGDPRARAQAAPGPVVRVEGAIPPPRWPCALPIHRHHAVSRVTRAAHRGAQTYRRAKTSRGGRAAHRSPQTGAARNDVHRPHRPARLRAARGAAPRCHVARRTERCRPHQARPGPPCVCT